MKKFRNGIFYVGIIGGFSILMYWIILMGVKLETGRNLKIPTSDKSQWNEFLDSLIKNLHHPLALLLAQIVTIIFVARIFGWICIKIKQPAVIGEMIAGIDGAFADRNVPSAVFSRIISGRIPWKPSVP